MEHLLCVVCQGAAAVGKTVLALVWLPDILASGLEGPPTREYLVPALPRPGLITASLFMEVGSLSETPLRRRGASISP